MFANGASGGCLDLFFFSRLSYFFSFSLGDGSAQTEIMSQRAINPKTINRQLRAHARCHQLDENIADPDQILEN